MAPPEGAPKPWRDQALVLRKGDSLFDLSGRTHVLIDVQHTETGWVHTTREDGFKDIFHRTDTITFLRRKS